MVIVKRKGINRSLGFDTSFWNQYLPYYLTVCLLDYARKSQVGFGLEIKFLRSVSLYGTEGNHDKTE